MSEEKEIACVHCGQPTGIMYIEGYAIGQGIICPHCNKPVTKIISGLFAPVEEEKPYIPAWFYFFLLIGILIVVYFILQITNWDFTNWDYITNWDFTCNSFLKYSNRYYLGCVSRGY